mgnify:FL=1|jgi:hypothetical protein
MTRIFLIILLFASGCTYTIIRPTKPLPHPLGTPLVTETYYYVIDTYSDIPDAKFETYAEAATYQKEYAEYHDYVIVKLDNKYNIYNMEPTN